MSPKTESLESIRDEVRRERLLDMERRLRPYRTATFAILAVSLSVAGPSVGWWWVVPLGVGFGGFIVADHFMHRSRHPAAWVAGAWAALSVLLAVAALVTGEAHSPLLAWFVIPAVTLGFRFEPRGMVFGTLFLLAMFLAGAVLPDPAAAFEHRQTLVAIAAAIASTVILSGALVESDRAHRRRSTIDPLTGLLNRNALEQRLAELDAGQEDPGQGRHALLLCDLDHFKRVNDRLGHGVGDAVLQEVAYTMRTSLRAGDSIYRVGGEEILVILPGASREDAVAISERLREAVRRRRPAGVQVTVSIGVAVTGSVAVDSEDLIARADLALYAAKAGGRDRVFCSN